MPAPLVCMGAMLQCPWGAAPTPLTAIPKGAPVLGENKPAATIMDNVPFGNIVPFGICNSPGNPAAVAAKAVGATVPCTPVTPAPWTPGSPTVLINNFPALNAMSTLMCSLGAGAPIMITNPGTVKTVVA